MKYPKNIWENKNTPPKEIKEIFEKYGILGESEIQKFWGAKYLLGDNSTLSPHEMWETGMKNEARTLAHSEAARIKDGFDITEQMQGFIKNFPEMELGKWGISEVPLTKIWLSCDSISLHLRSYKRRNLKEAGDTAFELLESGDILVNGQKVIDSKAILGDVSSFAEVSLSEATRIVGWFVNASKYDTNLFFRRFSTSFIDKPDGKSVILTPTGK